jgi:transposase
MLALTFEEPDSSATEHPKSHRRDDDCSLIYAYAPRTQYFANHPPSERVAIDPPTACEYWGGNRSRKLGEDVTWTLEFVPRPSKKVIETVREKFLPRL